MSILPGLINRSFIQFHKFSKMRKNLALFFVYVLMVSITAKTVTAQNSTTVKDQEGNIYKVVKIGSQTWMAENLKATKFNDGTAIPLVSDKNTWNTSMAPAFCWYENDTVYKSRYGALYNGYAVNTNRICPTGWHVSTDSEWTILTDFLGGKNSAGGKLKESGTGLWKDTNTGATNESGFTALPGGTRFSNGLFFTKGTAGYWWTFNGTNALNGWYWNLGFSTNVVSRNFHDSTNGFSVRCVKD